MNTPSASTFPGPRTLESFDSEVAGYYLNAIRDFQRLQRFEGLRVLEIGGSSLPAELVLGTLGVAQWVCVDILNHASGSYQRSAHQAHYETHGVEPLTPDSQLPDRPYVIYDGSADTIPASFENKFDIVFSINAFEHIQPLQQVLDRAHKALHPDGILFSQFGPIWSCIVGSHFWVRSDYNFNTPDPLPPWAHLLMSREEIDQHLREHGVDDDARHHTLYQIFESTFVNRRFFEDYAAAMAASDFRDFSIEPRWPRPVPPEMQQRLQARHPDYRDFSAYGVCIVARKTVRTGRAGTARSVLLGAAGGSTADLAALFDGAAYHRSNLRPPSEPVADASFEARTVNDLNEAMLVRSAVAHLGTATTTALLQGQQPAELWLAHWPPGMAVQSDEAVDKAVVAQLAQRPFCLADPLFALTAPIWLQHAPDVVLLCSLRHPAEAAAATLHWVHSAPHLRNHRISAQDALDLWSQSCRRLLELYRRRPNVLFVGEAELRDAQRLRSLADFLGTDLTVPQKKDSHEAIAGGPTPDAESLALWALLRQIASADFGRQRQAVQAFIDDFDQRFPHRPAALPPGWQLVV